MPITVTYLMLTYLFFQKLKLQLHIKIEGIHYVVILVPVVEVLAILEI